jgi:hypothetical protein
MYRQNTIGHAERESDGKRGEDRLARRGGHAVLDVYWLTASQRVNECPLFRLSAPRKWEKALKKR